MPGFDNNVVYAGNVDFTGGSPVAGQVTADGQILIGATAAPHIRAGSISSGDGSLTVTPGAGTLSLVGTQATTAQKGSVTLASASEALLASDSSKVISPATLNSVTAPMVFTGFESWSAAGPYFDDTTLGTFRVLVGGTGYIKSKQITWSAQDITGLTAGETWFIYIDNSGTIGKTSTYSELLYEDNIVLFECLRDSTLINNQITVRENHPYKFQVAASSYIHETVGTVIENNTNGANITLNGTQKIQINGADVLSDHGLETVIPDSSGVAVTFRKMYTTAAGKWATQNVSDTFSGYYNNAGTPTALGASKFAVYTLYVSKDNANSTTPTYYAVLNTSQYNNLSTADSAISSGTIARASNELALLELCQLGFIVFSQASNSIVQVTISKSTLRSTLSTAGTSTAALINTNTASYNGWLSASETTVQASLDVLDDVLIGGTSGQIVASNGAGTKPTYTTATYPKTAVAGTLLGCSITANTITAANNLYGSFKFTSAGAGFERNVTVEHTDNTNAGSHSIFKATVGGGSGGDAKFQSIVTGGQTWSFGGDNSDSDSFVLSANANLGTSNVFKSNTAGILSMPLQSAASAFRNADIANATGDGTVVNIVFNQEYYDIKAEYDTGTGVFTVTVDGLYLVIVSVYLKNVGAAHTACAINIHRNAPSLSYGNFNPYSINTSSVLTWHQSTIMQCSAGDTIYADVSVSGGAKTVTLGGGANTTQIQIHKLA